jgi:hypothetical protein
VNGFGFIVAALAVSASGRIAPAGVISGQTGTDAVGPAQSLWTAQALAWNQPQPDPLTLTAAADAVERTIAAIPNFDRVTLDWVASGFANIDESSGRSREPVRWSAITPPAGLPLSTAPTTRPSITRRDAQWSDPVGVLFSEESIRPSSGFARFIPAPGVGSTLMLAAVFPLRRRRTPDGL